MNTIPKEAYVYQTEFGRCPFEEWLGSLGDRKGRAKIRAKIARARAGNLGQRETVGQGVVELKIDFGPGYRIYLGQIGQTVIILLCGGDKAAQEKDIETAHAYWADCRRRPHAVHKKIS